MRKLKDAHGITAFTQLDDMYGVQLNVLCGRGDLASWCLDYYQIEIAEPGLTGSTLAVRPEGVLGAVIIHVADFACPDYGLRTLVHECLHATCYILRSRDIHFSEATEEVYAYYQAYIFNLAHKALTKHYANQLKSQRTKR